MYTCIYIGCDCVLIHAIWLCVEFWACWLPQPWWLISSPIANNNNNSTVVCSNWGTGRILQSMVAGAQGCWSQSSRSFAASIVSDGTVSINVSWNHQRYSTATYQTQAPGRCTSPAGEICWGSAAHDRITSGVFGKPQTGEMACGRRSGVDEETAKCFVWRPFGQHAQLMSVKLSFTVKSKVLWATVAQVSFYQEVIMVPAKELWHRFHQPLITVHYIKFKVKNAKTLQILYKHF